MDTSEWRRQNHDVAIRRLVLLLKFRDWECHFFAAAACILPLPMVLSRLSFAPAFHLSVVWLDALSVSLGYDRQLIPQVSRVLNRRSDVATRGSAADLALGFLQQPRKFMLIFLVSLERSCLFL